jgi:hypothetical protein
MRELVLILEGYEQAKSKGKVMALDALKVLSQFLIRYPQKNLPNPS